VPSNALYWSAAPNSTVYLIQISTACSVVFKKYCFLTVVGCFPIKHVCWFNHPKNGSLLKRQFILIVFLSFMTNFLMVVASLKIMAEVENDKINP
jgi:hypothetical protein